MKKSILVVDDVVENIDILKTILIDKYTVRVATRGKMALKIAEKFKPDLILLDIMMPEMDGYEVCTKLKENDITMEIPVIFVTAMGEIEDEAKGFDVGAVDYIQKPISPAIVLRRVKTHLSLTKVDYLEELVESSIQMLGDAGHYNDSDTGDHIWRMAAYSKIIAKELGFSEEEVRVIELAAPLHDTGKIGTPDAILKAPRKLTDNEWKIMKEHSSIGGYILSTSSNSVFKMASEIAMSHHEKFDGRGYPDGLYGEEIPLAARIVAVADVFDALTSKRPYKDAWPIEKARVEISNGAGSSFDPQVVHAFEAAFDKIIVAKEGFSD